MADNFYELPVDHKSLEAADWGQLEAVEVAAVAVDSGRSTASRSSRRRPAAAGPPRGPPSGTATSARSGSARSTGSSSYSSSHCPRKSRLEKRKNIF